MRRILICSRIPRPIPADRESLAARRRTHPRRREAFEAVASSARPIRPGASPLIRTSGRVRDSLVARDDSMTRRHLERRGASGLPRTEQLDGQRRARRTPRSRRTQDTRSSSAAARCSDTAAAITASAPRHLERGPRPSRGSRSLNQPVTARVASTRPASAAVIDTRSWRHRSRQQSASCRGHAVTLRLIAMSWSRANPSPAGVQLEAPRFEPARSASPPPRPLPSSV